ncbi:MAG: hypothetical protein ABIJ81_03005 [Patescibacteria group bacterium]
MKYLNDITWTEVFENWRQREANNPGWIKCATKIKGWLDWESWRKFTANQLGLDKLNWKLYELSEPLSEIPVMLIGPYGGWQSRIDNKNKSTFNDLLSNKEQYEFFESHSTVSSLVKSFPKETELIGLLRKDLNKIVLVEGHHRAVAVTMIGKQGKIDLDTIVRIALAEMPTGSEEILFNKVLARGTSKEKK